jgi:hypothetical protein
MRQNERHKITLEKVGSGISVSYFKAVCLCGWQGEPIYGENKSRESGWKHLGEKQEEKDELGQTQMNLTKQMIYLASPHTHATSGIRVDRYLAALDCLDWMLRRGYWVFSPIVHSHNLPSNTGEKISWEHWTEFDTETITRMDELWVLIMPGTKESKGVRAEIKIAEIQGKKIIAIQKERGVDDNYVIKVFDYPLLDMREG